MRTRFLSIIVTLVMLSALTGGASGQGVGVSLAVETIPSKKLGDPARFVFAAKFLCGTIPSDPAQPEFPAVTDYMLVPGTYLTAINIHNPLQDGAFFTKKVVKTLPQHEELIPTPGDLVIEFLPPNTGREIDCIDIRARLPEPFPDLRREFVKGFVVIEAEVDLDVVGVYTLKNVR